jgi:hypothetical protein
VSQGSELTPVTGGTGALREGLADRTQQRGTLSLMRRAVKEGWVKPWLLPEGEAETLPALVAETVRKAAETGDARTVIGGAAVLRSFMADNTKLAESLDKAERLDEGDVTDRTAHEHSHTVYVCEPPRVIGEPA